MLVSLLTAGVILTAVSVSWALRALELTEAPAVLGLAVRFRSETRPMAMGGLGPVVAGAFGYNHAILESVYSPFAAFSRNERRTSAFRWHADTLAGYIGFPPYRR